MLRTFFHLSAMMAFSGLVQAEGLYAVRPLPGSVCLQLSLSPDQIADPTRGIPIRETPTASARVIGWTPSVVTAPAAQQATAGFIQISFPDGRRGWVQAAALKPWSSPTNPRRRCIPSIMSDGMIGYDFS